MTPTYHCPTCDREQRCEVHGQKSTTWDFADDYGNQINGGQDHYLVQCNGCGTVFYQAFDWNSEAVNQWYDRQGRPCSELVRDVTTYPKPASKSKPQWHDTAVPDELLKEVLKQTYTAYDNESYILTAIGLRTALDRATELLGIKPRKSFKAKLTELMDRGLIGKVEHDVLGVVTEGGNAAAHRAWSPDAEQVKALLSALDIFLQRTFLLAHRTKLIDGSIPKRDDDSSPPS